MSCLWKGGANAEDAAAVSGDIRLEGVHGAKIFMDPQVTDLGGADQTKYGEVDPPGAGVGFTVEQANDPVAVGELAKPNLAVLLGGVPG